MTDVTFAKQQFMRQLNQALVPSLYEGIESVYNTARDLCDRNGEPEKVLMTFQNLLSGIPKWSAETLEKECERVLAKSQCEDYIDELLSAVFLSYVKAFSAVRNASDRPITFDIETPTFESFLHQVYITCAREFWKNAALFRRRGLTTDEIHLSVLKCEALIERCVEDVVRNCLPLKRILKDYFTEGERQAALRAPALKDAARAALSAPSPAPPSVPDSDSETEQEAPVVPAPIPVAAPKVVTVAPKAIPAPIPAAVAEAPKTKSIVITPSKPAGSSFGVPAAAPASVPVPAMTRKVSFAGSDDLSDAVSLPESVSVGAAESETEDDDEEEVEFEEDDAADLGKPRLKFTNDAEGDSNGFELDVLEEAVEHMKLKD